MDHIENEQQKSSSSVMKPCPLEYQLLVRWTYLNRDLGKHHNVFIEEFPNCLFVRVISCGPSCSLKTTDAAGGVALIREEVMAANAQRKLDVNGKIRFDPKAPFLILEDDVLAFGKFRDI